MEKSEVLRLAKLARIEMPDSEAESLSHEFEAILTYVSEVKNAISSPNPSQPSPKLGEGEGGVHNVMREDSTPHESGIYTDKILKQAPKTDGQYIKVKKIL